MNTLLAFLFRALYYQERAFVSGVDIGYEFSECSKCLQDWQNIDYGCARHVLMCGYPLPSKTERVLPAFWLSGVNHAIDRIIEQTARADGWDWGFAPALAPFPYNGLVEDAKLELVFCGGSL